MTAQEWGIVIGVATAALLALGPWMFMVHAKLAVLSAQMTRLEEKVNQVFAGAQERLPWCIRHQTSLDEFARRLETHEIQLADLNERLQDE